jgi:glutaredoxin
MKQPCHISFIYFSWLILAGGLVFYFLRGSYLQAGLWIFFIALFLWLYVRYFPAVSRYMGYGSVEDRPAGQVTRTAATVTLYTGLGCPFCPLVRRRLHELQSRMGFDLDEVDVTLKPDLLISKGIRALPVAELGAAHLVGNATSEQLAAFITEHAGAPRETPPA